ncbi:MAG: 30S ribosomal protein S20 [Planctomycetaceae bacterium]
MPNNVNAKKALRQNTKRRAHNRSRLAALRTVVKKVRKLAEGDDAPAAQDAFKVACKRLDQAASKNLIHKNTASRTKSRLSKVVKGGKTS